MRVLTEPCSDYKNVYGEIICIWASAALMTLGVLCEFGMELLSRVWDTGCG